jgi:hypothetical protein
MEEIIEKTTKKGLGKVDIDPNIKLQILRFWARLVISFAAFGLFGWLMYTMIHKTEPLDPGASDLIFLGFGAFLPLIGMLSKHWYESPHEDIKPTTTEPTKSNDTSITP